LLFTTVIMRYREKMIEKSSRMLRYGKEERIKSISNWYNL
jgi:hypothetical protein